MACVVCCSPGVVYCDNDKALLCKDCDVRIHTSNAVAARHVRRVPCEGGCGKGASLFCRSDNAYMCEACHSANPLASTHDVEFNVPLSAIEQVPAIRGEIVVPGPCESVAQSAASPVDWFLDNDKKDITSDYGEGTILSPAGSEAVVPVISAAADEFAFTTPTTFKDIKDKMDFESLELDKAWLDMGFDFTDILSDLPSDAGLVPDFDMELAASDIISDAVVPSLPEELPAIESSEPPQLSSLRSEEPTGEELRAVAQDSAQPLHTAFHLTHPASMYFQPVLPQQQFLPSAFAPPPAPAPKAATAYNAALMSGANLTREQRVARYREKRKNRRFEKTIRYASRKAYAEIRPRIKGRFARKEEIEAWKAAHGGDDAVVPEVLDGF